jgi:hypothetical protein
MHAPGSPVDDPMAHGYLDVYAWAAAVKKAGTFDIEKVRKAASTLPYSNVGMGETKFAPNQSLVHRAYVGQVLPSGQFKILWQSKRRGGIVPHSAAPGESVDVAPATDPVPRTNQPRSTRNRQQLGYALVLIALATAPLYLAPYELSLLGRFLALAILALGVSLIWGTGGMLSLGQGVFFSSPLPMADAARRAARRQLRRRTQNGS